MSIDAHTSCKTFAIGPERAKLVMDECSADGLGPVVTQLEREANASAAIIDLLSRVAAAPDLRAAAYTIVGELAEYLHCDQVAFGYAKSATHRVRVLAVSGVAVIDPVRERTSLIEAAMSEARARSLITCWPPTGASERHATLAHRKLAEAIGVATVISSPLRHDGNTIGICTAVISSDPSELRRFLAGCSGPLAPVVSVVARSELSPIANFVRRIRHKTRLRRRKLVWAGLLVGTVIPFIRLPYKVSTDCVIQPTTRRYVAAPYEGIFEKSLVKLGDIVVADQILARMEGREIRLEIAGAAADRSRAAKERDVNLATSKVAAAQMSQLEKERIEHKYQVLTNRAKHLDIRSPVAGVVIAGDLARSEGMAVTIGQSLYEIAPLGQMVAELAIPDDEISHCSEGLEVELALVAHPEQAWTGRIAKIHPRSEVRGSDNVFIGEVPLDNREQMLRPGMKGHARVIGPARPLWWICLHKPLYSLRAWLGW